MRPPPTTAPVHSHPGSRRGIWTIVAIFVFGLLVFVGLYLAPRSSPPNMPPGLTSGVPAGQITGVLLDCRPLGAAPDAVAAAIRRLAPSPDLLLLVDIEASLVPSIAAAFGMEKSYHPELFQRAQPSAAAGGKIGVCLLSRHPMFEGTSVRLDRRVVGVEAALVVEDRVMQVRCLAIDDQDESPTAGRSAANEAPSQVVLTGGRIGGVWSVELNEGREITQPGLKVIRREEAPAAIAFMVGREADATPTTATAPALASPATQGTSRSAPTTGRAE